MKTAKMLIVYVIALISACTIKVDKSDDQSSEEGTLNVSTNAAAMDNSRTSLDWDGTYGGIIPCADCEGIDVQLTINNDLTYAMRSIYLGKDETPFTVSGVFEWSDDGSRITLGGPGGQKYQVGENVLFQLNSDGERISGELAEMYKLKKNDVVAEIADTKWYLVELMGKSYVKSEAEQHPFIEFSAQDNTVHGNAGCNGFFGPYETSEGNRIKLDRLASTMMACPNMETEDKLLEIFRSADNYAISNGILSLNKARMAPLARFQAE